MLTFSKKNHEKLIKPVYTADPPGAKYLNGYFITFPQYVKRLLNDKI